MSGDDDNPLGLPPEPPAPEPHEEPPPDARGRHEEWVTDHDTGTRDATPALGTRGEPASWRPAAEGEDVALARPSWGDAGWSFLYGPDTRYGDVEPEEGEVAAANRRMREGAMPDDLRGPFIKPPVWTWEVPLYFWVGGMASGSAFVALAADLAGDEWSASVARKVALAAVLPGAGAADRRSRPPGAIPEHAAHLQAALADEPGRVVPGLVHRRRRRRRGGGSARAAPHGPRAGRRERAARRLSRVLHRRAAGGHRRAGVGPQPHLPRAHLRLHRHGHRRRRHAADVGGHEATPGGHPTRIALSRLEVAAILAELTLSTVNERRLGRAGHVLSEGRPGRLFRTAKGLVGAGVALNLLGVRRVGPLGQNVASVLYLAGGLAFRFAWIEAGKASARDDEAVALMARGRVTADERLRRGTERRTVSDDRPPRARGAALAAAHAWSGAVGRASLLAERLLRRA